MRFLGVGPPSLLAHDSRFVQRSQPVRSIPPPGRAPASYPWSPTWFSDVAHRRPSSISGRETMGNKGVGSDRILGRTARRLALGLAVTSVLGLGACGMLMSAMHGGRDRPPAEEFGF